MAVLFTILLAIVLILLSSLYFFSIRKFKYWKKKNVPCLKPKLIFGNYQEYITLKRPIFEVAQEICRKFPDAPYIGTYYGTDPALLVQDPELIKLIMTKDFGSFSGREITDYSDREILTRNMFFTYGDHWKVIRTNTSALFTASKLKNMFPLIQNCVVKFEDMLNYEIGITEVMETRSVMARFTMDCIGSCVFGIDTNTMNKDIDENPFKKIGELVFENTSQRMLTQIARSMWPGIFYKLGMKLFPQEIPDFFYKLVHGVFKNRDFQPSSRKDFVDLVLNLRQNEYLTCDSILKSKKGEKISVKVDDDLLVAQCVLYFAAGYETSATASSFTLFHLAKNQKIQDRAFKEVDEYLRKKDGLVEYDCVSELPYLEACVDEALRLYPALGMLTREVMEPYVLPDGLELEKGMRVHLPVYHLHRCEKYFSDPEEFIPERFLPENKGNIQQYTYMPFGEGQRICVGTRVAKMMMMPGLITVLRRYHVELADGMPKKLTLESRAMVTQAADKLRLKFMPRKSK
ncbi:hypothetical protein O0L34_g15155 [Tuta absoluta]|nr:hypothetical protein O0L34_g15155 [Tuta absoluta]